MAECDKNPEIGDLIEIFKGPYQHWAVYVGNGSIVHFSPAFLFMDEFAGDSANSIIAVPHENGLVKKDMLQDVVGINEWEINNILDEEYEPLPVHMIWWNARALVGKEMPYCLFSYNCEHFATELRYGKAMSRQVRKAKENTRLVALGAFLSSCVMVSLALVGALIVLFISGK